MKSIQKEYLMAVFAIFCWGTNAPVSKVLLTKLTNMEVLCYSSTIAAIVLLTAIFISGQWRQFRQYRLKDIGQLALLGSVGFFLYTALYQYGLTVLPAQTACILNYLWPLMTVLFSIPILKEKLSFSKLLALFLSFLGVVIIVFQPGASSGSGLNLSGCLSCILAAACYGCFCALNKKRGGSQMINMFIYIGTSAVLALCAGLTEGALPEMAVGMHLPTAAQLPGLLWHGIFITAVAYLLWAMALQGGNTATISNFAFATPAISLFLSALFLKEPVYVTSVIGLIFILGGFFLQMFLERKHTTGA